MNLEEMCNNPIYQLFAEEYKDQKETIKRQKATIQLQCDHIDELQDILKTILKNVQLRHSISDGNPYYSFENTYQEYDAEAFETIEKAIKLFGFQEEPNGLDS